MRNCGYCHECGSPLRKVLDGEEWCPECEEYKRYRSHGWIEEMARPIKCGSTVIKHHLACPERKGNDETL